MFHTLFKHKKLLVGMIHLPPLLSYPRFPGIDECIHTALADLDALQRSGFDAVLLENNHDQPHTEFANEAQIASFTAIAWEVSRKTSISFGVQMMLNDWKASFAIAKTTGAQFTRLDVFVDHVTSQWGEIHPNPEEIIACKKELYSELILLTDIQVKEKTMLEQKDLLTSASQAIEHGSDALIITGDHTGEETPLEKIKRVKEAFPDISILVGAGIREETIESYLPYIDGAIVGTSIQVNGRVDYEKAKRLVEKRNSVVDR